MCFVKSYKKLEFDFFTGDEQKVTINLNLKNVQGATHLRYSSLGRTALIGGDCSAASVVLKILTGLVRLKHTPMVVLANSPMSVQRSSVMLLSRKVRQSKLTDYLPTYTTLTINHNAH